MSDLDLVLIEDWIETRTARLVGSVDEAMYENFASFVSKMGGKPFNISINSSGGTAAAAFAIVAIMDAYRTNIQVTAIGQCQSAATLILAAGDHRRIASTCIYMHHEDHGTVKGSISKMEREIAQLRRAEKIWSQKLAQHSKMPADFWEDEARSGDKYYTPKELLTFGIVDEIVD